MKAIYCSRVSNIGSHDNSFFMPLEARVIFFLCFLFNDKKIIKDVCYKMHLLKKQYISWEPPI